MGQPSSFDADALLALLAERARASGRFGAVSVAGGVLSCEAPRASAPAFFSLIADNGGLWAALCTPDRYLSQSVEQDLVHTGDKVGDLLRDELIDQEHPAPYTPAVEHFRDAARQFTFRSRVPAADLTAGKDEALRRLWITLCAYQACFNNLGDVDAGDDE